MLSFSLQSREDFASASATLRGPSLTYVLRYAPEQEFVSREGNVVTYGFGSGALAEGRWRHFARDLMRDLQKGIAKKAFQVSGGEFFLAIFSSSPLPSKRYNCIM